MSTRAYQEKVYNAKNAQNAAQAAQEAAIAQAQSNIARTNNQLINAYNAQNATPKVYIHSNDASISNASPATLRQQPTANPNGGGSGTYQQSAAVVSDPYADLYAIYQQKLDAQNAANEQRRAARLGALQSNYANAKSRLSDAYNSGETALNTDADKALRESYVNMMLNQKRLNQQLESQGINGGAMESSLARAYNDYGNSRNNIEQGRLDALKELLSQYQGQLGDMESAYNTNLADIDSDYFGNGLDFVTDYYDTIANLQAQNAASNLKNALGKSSGSSVKTSDATSGFDKNILSTLAKYKGNLNGANAYLDYIGVPQEQKTGYLLAAGLGTGEDTSNNTGLDTDIVNLVKGFKSTPASAVKLLRQRGVPEEQINDYLWAGGIDPDLVAEASGYTPEVANTIINNLKRIYPTTAQDGLSTNESLYKNVIEQLNKYADMYGLTSAQAQELLKRAGF